MTKSIETGIPQQEIKKPTGTTNFRIRVGEVVAKILPDRISRSIFPQATERISQKRLNKNAGTLIEEAHVTTVTETPIYVKPISKEKEVKAPERLSQESTPADIFTYIRAQKNIAKFENRIGMGTVKLPSGKYLDISLMQPVNNFSEQDFIAGGFSNAQRKDNLIRVTGGDGNVHRNIHFKDDGSMQVATLKGKYKFLGKNEFVKGDSIEPEELDAIRTIATLSAIPGQIIDRFETYSNFESQLPKEYKDDILTVLEYESNIFPEGLNQFIHFTRVFREKREEFYDSPYFEKISKRADAAKNRFVVSEAS